MSELPPGKTSPLGEVRHVPASRREIPHAVTGVEVDEGAGEVRFEGPAWAGQSDRYVGDLRASRGDVNVAIRAALEERMYGPNAPYSVDPEDPRSASAAQ